MGINRIRLQNGAMGDPRVDARMQQTYQQNIADNQAQQARNEGILQAAASRLFPEGNFQQIRANAPDQTTYNIDATADLVRNNPFGIIGEVAAPALTAAASIPYDVIQGIGRAVDQSNIDTSPYGGIVDDTEIPTGPSLSDLGQAIDAENPLSSALERTIGAATPLAERISGQDYSPNYLETATPTPDAAETYSEYKARMLDTLRKSSNQKTTFTDLQPDGSFSGTSRELPQEDYYNYMLADAYGLGFNPITGLQFGTDDRGVFTDKYKFNQEMADFKKNNPDYNFVNLASGGRVGFQDGSPLEMAKAQEAAASDPALDAIRQQLFGEDYVQDIGEGRGIAQYYTGFGLPQSLRFTPPVVEEAAPAVDVTQPVVDTGEGGGGGATLPGFDVDSPKNTDFEQGLIDQGIGVQGAIGDPVVAPGEIPVTQQEMDDFNAIPVTQPMAAGPFDYLQPETSDPFLMSGAAGGARLPQIGYEEGEVDPNLAAAVGLKDTTSLGGANLVTLPSGNVFAADDPMLSEKIDFQTPEQTNAINEAFNSVKDLGEAGVDKLRDSLVALGGKVKEGFDNTIEIGGKAIDLTKSLVGGAISLVSGIPGVGLLLNVLPEGGPTLQTEKAQSIGLAGEGQYKDKYGINTQSALGDYDQYNIERVEKLETALEKAKDKYDTEQEYLNMTTRLRQELEDRKEYNTISGVGGDIDERDQLLEDIQLQNKIEADKLGISGDIGVEGEDEDRFDEEPTGLNPFADIDTGAGEFDITSETIGPYELAQKEFDDRYETIDTPGGTITIDKITGMEANFDTTPEDLSTITDTPVTGIKGSPSEISGPQVVEDPPEDTSGQGGGADYKDDPAPSAPKGPTSAPPGEKGGPGYVDPGPTPTKDFYQDPITTGGGGNQGDPGGSKGCVIATHAVNSGAFTKDTKREAVRWCVKNLHRTWWGEAVRKGYKYYGQKAIEQGKAKNHYQEFKDYVAFGTGKRRTLKTGWTFVYRTIQFFLKGLTL